MKLNSRNKLFTVNWELHVLVTEQVRWRHTLSAGALPRSSRSCEPCEAAVRLRDCASKPTTTRHHRNSGRPARWSGDSILKRNEALHWLKPFRLYERNQPRAEIMHASRVYASTGITLWKTWILTTPSPLSQISRMRSTLSPACRSRKIGKYFSWKYNDELWPTLSELPLRKAKASLKCW